jgi:hypothetical protein
LTSWSIDIWNRNSHQSLENDRAPYLQEFKGLYAEVINLLGAINLLG